MPYGASTSRQSVSFHVGGSAARRLGGGRRSASRTSAIPLGDGAGLAGFR